MVSSLQISRFKSIRDVSLSCRRVNVFIGEPDTGKTNILEALQVLACLGCGFPMSSALRLSQNLGFEPLFYRQFLDEPARICVSRPAGETTVELRIGDPDRRLHCTVKTDKGRREHLLPFGSSDRNEQLSWIRWYTYASSENWQYQPAGIFGGDVVNPPQGSNLTYVSRHSKSVYEFLKEQVASLGWRLKFDQSYQQFRLSEVRQDEIFDYNIDLLSDSRKRFIFYLAILLTSRNVTLILDEPDVYAFPPYPKQLGETIASDQQGNQFFLTTHNPYFLSALVEKTPADDLAVFVCFRGSDGSTQAHLLNPRAVAEVIEQGPGVFFNLSELIGR